MIEKTIFWDNFQRKATTWASHLRSGREQVVFEEINNLLDNCRLPYCFDITHDDSFCYLVFSPEGDDVFAEKIDELIMTAPAIPKWKVYGRRQRKPVEDACAIVRQLYLIDPSRARFRLREKKNGPFIEMFVSPDADLTSDEQRGLINTFLWHFFGEDMVMTKKIGGEVVLAKPPMDGTITASELAKLF